MTIKRMGIDKSCSREVQVRRVLWLWIGAFVLVACSGKTEYEIEFIKGCKLSGNDEKACECLWGEVRKSYSEEELIRMSDSNAPQPELGKVVLEASFTCRVLL